MNAAAARDFTWDTNCAPHEHRERHPHCPLAFNACVARPVSHKERMATKDARDAVQFEWDNLRALPGGAWDKQHPRELRDVLKGAAA